MTHPTVTSERIDDLPLLIDWLQQMHIDTSINAAVGAVHGNREGLSYGHLALVFIAYMLSECRHALSPVRAWVQGHRECLEQALGQPLRDTDFTDDRLEDLLDAVGTPTVQEQIEMAIGQHVIRAYELPTETAHIDTTTVSVYHQPEGEGLLAYGQSKDHRPDLRQFKEALGTLDPVGVPLYSATVGGQCADDPLYLPAWRQMVQIIGHAHFLTVGDCKMGSLATRAQIQKGHGYYLVPLPMTGTTPDDLRRWVLAPPTPPVDIFLPQTPDGAPAVGQGFEVAVARTWADESTEEIVTWTERVLVLHSAKLAQRQQHGLTERLARAERALSQIKTGPDTDAATRTAAAEAILQRHHVQDYLHVTWTAHTTEVKRYLKRGRHGPDSPFEMIAVTTWTVTAARQTEAIETFHRLAGWRLFVTNAPAPRVDLTGAVACYRAQWQPERGFHRLKGAALAIRPLLLRTDLRISGLLGVLVLALRALTLFEFVVRRTLQQQGESLQGLYDGNPKRATDRPTTERMLKAFDGLTRYRCCDGETVWYQVTPLSPLQKRILELAGIPPSVYAVPSGGLLLAGP